MPEFIDVESMFFNFNLTGDPEGTLSIPSLTLSKDALDNYIIDYTFFRDISDVTSTSYYSSTHSVALDIVNSSSYNPDIENAIETILNPTDFYSTSFTDIAKIDFQENTTSTGVIAFGQLDGKDFPLDPFGFPLFSDKPNLAAFSVRYDDTATYASEEYGDIFINTDHDAQPNIPAVGTNFWTADPSISSGTRAYKILMEEISHSLGIDIVGIDSNGDEFSKNPEIDSHKYTVTSRNVHPDMVFQDDVPVPGILAGEDIFGPFPKGLQLFDIAALQAIYGADTTTRAENNTTYKEGQGFGTNVSDAFVYTIWDAGGTGDTIDVRNYTTGVEIDLREGHFSSIGDNGDGQKVAWDTGTDDAGNVAIAYGAEIENATGTKEFDHLIGNDLAIGNKLEGLSGNDILRAGLGNNEVLGGKGNDIIIIASGASGTYDGGIGNDTFIVKSVGNIDTSVLTLIGGSGFDTITFEGGSYVSDQRDPKHVKLLTGDGTFEAELDGFEEVHIKVGRVLPNVNADYTLTGGPTYDYSHTDTSVGGADFDITVYTSIDQDAFNDFTFRRIVSTNIDINGFDHDGTTLDWTLSGSSSSSLHSSLDGTSIGSFLGTDNDDTVSIHKAIIGSVAASAGSLSFALGLGNDTVEISQVSTEKFGFTYKGGNDTITYTETASTFYGETVGINMSFTRAETGVSFSTDASGQLSEVVLTTSEGSLKITGLTPQIIFSNGEILTFDTLGNQTVTTNPYTLNVEGAWASDTYIHTDNISRSYSTLGGDDVVMAGSGDDVIYGFSGNNQLFGGDGDDDLNGGVGYDRLDGGTGFNTLSGGRGDDIIFVGQGTDTVTGGLGTDRIVVKSNASGSVDITDFDLSNDIVDLSNVSDISSFAALNFSQSGSDTLIYAEGGTFAITLDNVDFTNLIESNFTFGSGGGAFTNTLPPVPTIVQTGTSSDETLTAVAFDGEVLNGLGGNDWLFGGDGDDYLYGGDGDDYLYGYGGNNQLFGGYGDDWLFGESGNDFYLMDIDADLGFDSISDTGGTDALVLNGNIETYDIAFSVSGDTLQVSSTGFTLWQGVDIYDFFSAPYTAGEEYKVEYIVIQDVIYDLEDVYNTGVWTPAVIGTGGNTQNAPNAFDDLITIEGGGSFTGSVLANNGNGVDYDTDGSFLEVIPFSQTGAYGTLDVAADGSISIVAPYNYVGTHTFSYTLRDFDGNTNQATVQLDFVAENIAPVAGFIDSEEYVEDGTLLSFTPTFTDADGDALTYSMSMQDGSVVPDFSIDPNTGLISGTASMGYATYPIRITAFDGEAEVTHDMNIIVYVEFQGTVNVDYIHGGIGVDYIYGNDGDDHLYGYDGYDELYGEAGNDYLYGYEGDDDLNGNEGDDHLYGNEGNDALYGGSGSDTIYGHEGDDFLFGGTEDDYLYGLEGDDFLFGEDGNDRLRGDDDANSDTYVGAGNDTLYGEAGNDNMAGGAGNDILYGGVGNDVLYGNAGDDILLAEEDDDFLYGGAGTDSLDGGDGNDKLYGEAGTDTLNGGAGTDTLYGGDDNDILIGGTGTDFLYGQGGADTFKLDLTSIDRLSDFDASEGDTIDIADLLIGYDSATDDINDFVTLVYRNAGRTDIRVNDDGQGNDLPYVGIVFSDFTGETVDSLVASGTLVVA